MELGILGIRLLGQFMVMYLSMVVYMLADDPFNDYYGFFEIMGYMATLCLLIGGTLFVWFFKW